VRRLLAAGLTSALAVALVGACGNGSTGSNPATASTFAIDTQVTDGFQTMVASANQATAGLGQASTAADACATAWNGIRARVTQREPALGQELDAAVAALQRGAAAHDAVAVANAAATIARDAARYTRLYP